MSARNDSDASDVQLRAEDSMVPAHEHRGDRARRRRAPRDAAIAFLAYLLLSVGFFGAALLPRAAHAYVGRLGTDAVLFMWFLAWWPFALTHGLNPLITHAVWTPTGMIIAWRTSVPGVSLLMSPVTLLAGPAVAYNVAVLLAPALAAWTAYLLCRHVTGAFWPALAAGYLFGFSSYELAHLVGGHLNLVVTCLVPLTVYVVVLRLEDQIRPQWFAAALAGLFMLQFLTSTEVFATLTLFGAVAIAFALLVAPRAKRPHLLNTAWLIGAAYLAALALLSPYLAYAFAHGSPQLSGVDPTYYSANLLNVVTPTDVSLSSRLLSGPPPEFSGNVTEAGTYLGIPLLIVLALFAWERWRTASGAFLLLSMAFIGLAALGPSARIAGANVPLPIGQALLHLPLVRLALPARFMMYVSLIAAVSTAIWLAAATRPRAWGRWALVLAAVAATLPNVPPARWISSLETPAFITDGLYRKYVVLNDNLLVIPYGGASQTLLWQAQSRLYFRLAAAYTGPFAWEFIRWPISDSLTCGTLIPDHKRQLEAFLANAGVNAIVVVDGTPGRWSELFAPLNAAAIHTGGVTVYQVPLARLRAAPIPTPEEMRQQGFLAQFSALISAAARYTAGPGATAPISVPAVQREGLLPDWGCTEPGPAPDSGVWTHANSWLGPVPGSHVGVAILGAPEDLKPIAARFGPYAARTLFPYSMTITLQLPTGAVKHVTPSLVMVFTRSGLAQAAALARRDGAP